MWEMWKADSFALSWGWGIESAYDGTSQLWTELQCVPFFMVSAVNAGRRKLAAQNNPWERRSNNEWQIRKKNIAVIACVLFVFVTLASLFYIAKEENHQCTGEDCPICACIRQAKQIVKNVGTAVNYSVTAGLIFVQRSGILATGCLCVLCITLVSQKVRLDS